MFGKRKSSPTSDRADAQYSDPASDLPSGTVSRPITKAPPRASADAYRQVPGAAAEPSRRVIDPAQVQQRRSEARPPVETATHEGRKLVVGRDISLAGEIKSCEKLVVEGQVEAHLNECRVLQISQSGIYKGTAAVDQAEISGLFEGELAVQERLVLRSTGRIVGVLHYAEMEVERGGRIIGEMDQLEVQAAPVAAPPRAETRPEPEIEIPAEPTPDPIAERTASPEPQRTAPSGQDGDLPLKGGKEPARRS